MTAGPTKAAMPLPTGVQLLMMKGQSQAIAEVSAFSAV